MTTGRINQGASSTCDAVSPRPRARTTRARTRRLVIERLASLIHERLEHARGSVEHRNSLYAWRTDDTLRCDVTVVEIVHAMVLTFGSN